MKATTIKLHKSTKSALDGIRTKDESYDKIITKLIEKSKKKGLKENLIEGYKSIGKKQLKEFHEWEKTSPDWEY